MLDQTKLEGVKRDDSSLYRWKEVLKKPNLIKVLSRMLTNRLLDQASDDAIEDRKKEKFITFSEFARCLPPCAARDLIEREHPDMFTDDDL